MPRRATGGAPRLVVLAFAFRFGGLRRGRLGRGRRRRLRRRGGRLLAVGNAKTATSRQGAGGKENANNRNNKCLGHDHILCRLDPASTLKRVRNECKSRFRERLDVDSAIGLGHFRAETAKNNAPQAARCRLIVPSRIQGNFRCGFKGIAEDAGGDGGESDG